MRFLNLIGIFLLLGFNSAIAQKSVFRKADHEFNQMRYRSAIQYYEKGLKSDSLNIQSIERLAASYENIKDYKNAEKWFSKAINLSSGNVNSYLHYAEALASNNKYESSAYWYQKLGATGDSQATRFSKMYSENMNEFYADSNQWKITFTSLNTTFDEFSPVFFKKGLMFSSNRELSIRNKFISGWDYKPFIDLYMVDDTELITFLNPGSIDKSTNEKEFKIQDNRTVGDFGVRGISGSGVYSFNKKPTEVNRINGLLRSKFHDGPVSLPEDEKVIMFTRNSSINGKESLSRDGVNKLKLYTATLIKNEWKDIKEFEYNSNEYSTAHPALSADGNVLYFSSDMPGGIGGMDLYFSIKQNDKWSKPVNLGPKLNTKGDEVFPYLRDKGELYFSSTGLPGLGGLDIFKVGLDKFIPMYDPVNVGYPVNSEKDDFGIIYGQKTQSGYFSSNRKGNDDIYSFEYNSVDPASKDKKIANKLIRKKSSVPDVVRRINVEVRTISSSGASLHTPEKTSNAIKNSRLTELECLELRKKFQVSNIYYNSDQYYIRESEFPALESLISLMKEYPDIQVKVSSHTDASASYLYNDLLSKYRSMVVKSHLMSRGIAENRIGTESFGKRRLLMPCPTDNCITHQLNRRTEFHILYNGVALDRICK